MSQRNTDVGQNGDTRDPIRFWPTIVSQEDTDVGQNGSTVCQARAVQRIAVIGTSGSGKTSLARRLAAELDAPHLELDAVFHQAGWTPLPDDDFRAEVTAFCAGDRWVTCGKYAVVRDLLFARADTIVCLDHGRLRQTLRVARRTARRGVRREELWNGNRESLRALWPFQDAEASIVRWAWDNVPRVRRLFVDLMAHPPHEGVRVIRLRGWPEIDRFLAEARRIAPAEPIQQVARES